MTKIKYPKNIIRQRAALQYLKLIAFDLRAMEQIKERIQSNFDKLALDILGKVRKNDA